MEERRSSTADWLDGVGAVYLLILPFALLYGLANSYEQSFVLAWPVLGGLRFGDRRRGRRVHTPGLQRRGGGARHITPHLAAGVVPSY